MLLTYGRLPSTPLGGESWQVFGLFSGPAWRCQKMTQRGPRPVCELRVEADRLPAEDPWLKVRIDGKEGWVHTPEDFMAIGLPQAG